MRHRWRVLRKVQLAGVSIIATDDRGHVLLLRHSYGPDVWALPGGGMHRGENPDEAARRELREEVGCECHQLRLIVALEEIISGSPHTAYVFEGVLEGPPVPDGREIVEAQLFAPDALPDRIGHTTARRLERWLERRRG